jgi:uncharacterized membrane protein YraQ (UPF0718 family)
MITITHHDHHHSPQPLSFKDRFWESMTVAGDDFFDMGRYLVVGSMLAAGNADDGPAADIADLWAVVW